MSYVVVGADKLGNIEELLAQKLGEDMIHISGRKKREATFKLPHTTEGIVVFTDFVNHNLARHIKKEAKRMQVPIIFSKRSIHHLEDTLEKQTFGLLPSSPF